MSTKPRFPVTPSGDEPPYRYTPAGDEHLGPGMPGVPHDPHAGAAMRAVLPGLPGTGHQAVISTREDGATRRYTLSTTQPLRPQNHPTAIDIDESDESDESGQGMVVRTGNLMVDGLFALALAETRANRVDRIHDARFADVELRCFETGADWHFVWTRDTAYAAHLALAAIDPERVKRSLIFKTSGKRVPLTHPALSPGPEIVQDTGSGGSWPVSTDRVVWALGAWELLKYLDGDERTAFLYTAYAILAATIATDREAAFDVRDGLYRGEHSFLDWREQSYPTWVARDVVHIAMAKALSTNVGHYAALTIAAQLADELEDSDAARRYRGMAADLRAAIDQTFWHADAGLYRSLKHTELDPAICDTYDLLGQSLAVLFDVADADKAAQVVARYPHGPAGPPVMWPQQPSVPIYHNRATWPFVTAYALHAAKKVRNPAVAGQAVTALMRAAALNLSNMENLEFLTGSPGLLDQRRPELFGPVVCSRRQLWSVAGYLSMMLDVVFGRETTQEGIRFQPYITREMRHSLFAESRELWLKGLAYRGRRLDVCVVLPEADGNTAGDYAVASVLLDGSEIRPGQFVPAAGLSEASTMVVTLGAGLDAPGAITLAQAADPLDIANPAVFAPPEPAIVTLSKRVDAPGVVIELDRRGARDTYFRIYRDGVLVADRIFAPVWLDTGPLDPESAYAYAAAQVYAQAGHVSHHSRPRWLFLSECARPVDLAAGDALVSPDGAEPVRREHGAYFAGFGEPGHTLEVSRFIPAESGEYLLSVRYRNTAADVTSGITAAVKWLEVTEHRPAADAATASASDANSVADAASDMASATAAASAAGHAIASGIVIMPHQPPESIPEGESDSRSSYLRARLRGGVAYRLVLSDFFNMSYLDVFALYRGAGGASGPHNRADIAAITVQRMRP